MAPSSARKPSDVEAQTNLAEKSTLLSFFAPSTSAPSPSTVQTPKSKITRPSPHPSFKPPSSITKVKVKRKMMATITIDDSDDSDLDIVEPKKRRQQLITILDNLPNGSLALSQARMAVKDSFPHQELSRKPLEARIDVETQAEDGINVVRDLSDNSQDLLPNVSTGTESHEDDQSGDLWGAAETDSILARDDDDDHGEEGVDEEWGEEQATDDADDLDEDVERVDEGDEAMCVQGEDDDDDIEILGDVKSAKLDGCPICSTGLQGLAEKEALLHVDQCLDGSSTSSTTSFFPRLSSLFRSDASTSKIGAPSSPFLTSASTAKPLDNLRSKSNGKAKSTSSLRPLSAFLPSFFTAAEASAAPVVRNAFSALMGANHEEKEWKVAEKSDNTKGRMPSGEKRAVPFYKWVEGMCVTVDAFKYGNIPGCNGYFLSHAHSDHYQQLNSSWSYGPIYCSRTTANLIKLKLNVKDQYLKVLPMDETVEVCGLKVTLIDANHCPGSVLFVFEGPHLDPKSPFSKNPKKIFRHLHVGDFRASPAHLRHPALSGKKIDTCYLDTTYLDPKYCFPSQELVIDACSELICARAEGDQTALYRTKGTEQIKSEKLMKGWLEAAKEEDSVAIVKVDEEISQERLLVVVGTYSIGKERIVKGIAEALGTKIYCNDNKLALLQAQDDPALHDLITRDPFEAQVHIVYLQEIKQDSLSSYLARYSKGPRAFTTLVGLRPTGWTYTGEGKQEKLPSIEKILAREKTRKFSPAGMTPQRDSTKQCLGFGVPYSEHSSMFELTCFALSLDYVKMIPTVNVHTSTSRAKMNYWFEKWKEEKKRRRLGKIADIVPRSENYW